MHWHAKTEDLNNLNCSTYAYSREVLFWVSSDMHMLQFNTDVQKKSDSLFWSGTGTAFHVPVINWANSESSVPVLLVAHQGYIF